MRFYVRNQHRTSSASAKSWTSARRYYTRHQTELSWWQSGGTIIGEHTIFILFFNASFRGFTPGRLVLGLSDSNVTGHQTQKTSLRRGAVQHGDVRQWSLACSVLLLHAMFAQGPTAGVGSETEHLGFKRNGICTKAVEEYRACTVDVHYLN